MVDGHAGEQQDRLAPGRRVCMGVLDQVDEAVRRLDVAAAEVQLLFDHPRFDLPAAIAFGFLTTSVRTLRTLSRFLAREVEASSAPVRVR